MEHGLLMYAHDDLAELGRLAHLAKEARFGKKAFFNHNVHINPTNVAVPSLAVSALSVVPAQRRDDAYAFSTEAFVNEGLARYADRVSRSPFCGWPASRPGRHHLRIHVLGRESRLLLSFPSRH